jgi:agmatinase
MLRKLENVQRIVQVGTRSFRTAEQDYRDTIADGNVVVTTRDYQTGGVQQILRHLVPGVPVYVSVDVDVLDISLVPGVATPEPSGLTYADLRDALVAIAANSDTCGIDLVELNPMLDVASQVTAFLTTQLMVEFACHAFARREAPVANSPYGQRS